MSVDPFSGRYITLRVATLTSVKALSLSQVTRGLVDLNESSRGIPQHAISTAAMGSDSMRSARSHDKSSRSIVPSQVSQELNGVAA